MAGVAGVQGPGLGLRENTPSLAGLVPRNHFYPALSCRDFRCRPSGAARDTAGFGLVSGVAEAAVLHHGFDAWIFSSPCGVHLCQVFGVAARQNHVAEAVAIGASHTAVIFEP